MLYLSQHCTTMIQYLIFNTLYLAYPKTLSLTHISPPRAFHQSTPAALYLTHSTNTMPRALHQLTSHPRVHHTCALYTLHTPHPALHLTPHLVHHTGPHQHSTSYLTPTRSIPHSTLHTLHT